MITILLNDQTKVQIYNDAKDMPAYLYKEFQKYLLQDSGMGSTMDDITNRLSALFKQLAAKHHDGARKEVENLYYTHYAIITGINYKHLSFGCLIHSVEGRQVMDHSPEGITELIKTLSEKGLTQQMIEDKVEESKKNSSPNYKFIFPNFFLT